MIDDGNSRRQFFEWQLWHERKDSFGECGSIICPWNAKSRFDGNWRPVAGREKECGKKSDAIETRSFVSGVFVQV